MVVLARSISPSLAKGFEQGTNLRAWLLRILHNLAIDNARDSWLAGLFALDYASLFEVLDPGLAFGTGSHPTTHLCLAWLSQTVKKDQSVLDYGCGSGILAIAAKKFGASKVVGTDIDAQAIQASLYNAEQNAVQASFYHANDYQTEEYDIVVANILSSALSVLAPALAKSCKSGGKIALSGILKEQAEAVSAIYAPWFDMQAPVYMDAWVLLTGSKK